MTLPAVAFTVERLLAISDPHVAGATMVAILHGLRDDLIARGWAEELAHGVVLRFGDECTALLAAIRDRQLATVH
jgi:hypothetical protein